MIDLLLILTPFLLLAVIALLGFVGCDLVFPLRSAGRCDPCDPRTNHSQVRPSRY